MSAALLGMSGQGTEWISGLVPGPAKVATRIFSRAIACLPLFAPGGEGLLEGTVAGSALLDCQDGAAPVAVHDRDIEPGAASQELEVAPHVLIRSRQADQEISRRDFDGEAGERRAACLLGLLHEDARNVGDAPEGKIGRQIEH